MAEAPGLKTEAGYRDELDALKDTLRAAERKDSGEPTGRSDEGQTDVHTADERVGEIDGRLGEGQTDGRADEGQTEGLLDDRPVEGRLDEGVWDRVDLGVIADESNDFEVSKL